MKVLQINVCCGNGSTGKIVADLAKAIGQNGDDCLVAYGRSCIPIEGVKTVRIGNTLDNYWHALYTRITDKTGFASTRATHKFINEVVIPYDPDVIHLHNLVGYYINIEVLFNYLASASKRVVWTLHSCWEFTGHCHHFDYINCNRWKTGCHDCPQKSTNYPQSYFLDNSRWNYKHKKDLFTSVKDMRIITVSKWQKSFVEKSFLNKYPIDVIYNGIDLNVFKPTISNFRNKHHLQNRIVILGVASIWGKRKGLDAFLKLASMLDERYKIVLVGLSHKQMNSLPQNIIGLPRTTDMVDLAAIYTAADIFVNPSVEETFGLTNIEALACGTPVIAYDAGATTEIINLPWGIIVKRDNFEQLVSSIFFSSITCQLKNNT